MALTGIEIYKLLPKTNCNKSEPKEVWKWH